jgi:hypothetical protein
VNASASQKNVLRWASADLALGTPVEYADGGQKWYVFSDTRFTQGEVATLGQMMKGLASWSFWAAPRVKDVEGNDVGVDRRAAAAEVAEFVKDDRVHPSDIDYGEVANTWQHTLKAQGAPAAIMAADTLPADWEVVTDGE